MCSEEEIVDSALAVLETGDAVQAMQLERCGREYLLEVTPPLGTCRKVLFSTKATWFVLLDSRNSCRGRLGTVANVVSGRWRRVARSL